MPPAILITRPEAAACRLADHLRGLWGCGARIVIAPMMRIEFLDVQLDLSDVTTLIFTSVNGVDAFARLCPRRDLPCYSVGHTTGQTARANGFKAYDAGGDVKALCARMIADQVRGPCLHLRGEVAAGGLMACLQEGGITARSEVLYRQKSVALSPEAETLLAGQDPVILPLYSPRSARLFFAAARPKAPLLIAAISPNAAQEVPACLPDKLIIATRPDGKGMIAAIERLHADAIRLEGDRRAQ